MTLKEIAPELNFILSRGMVPGRWRFDPTCFGNASIELAGVPFCLIIIRDRGQIHIDVGLSFKQMISFPTVLSFLDPTLTEEQLYTGNIQFIATALNEKWDAMSELFRSPTELAKLRLFEHAEQQNVPKARSMNRNSND